MRLGNTLVAIGIVVVAAGVVLRFAPWLVSWFGRLPGDIRIERDTTRVYIPVTSMILTSIGLTVLLAVIARFRG
ncbi:MAG TPA: DUF2905 domain-containing protein [Acidimicrobiia bacterium]|jgi:hypothetical protein